MLSKAQVTLLTSRSLWPFRGDDKEMGSGPVCVTQQVLGYRKWTVWWDPPAGSIWWGFEVPGVFSELTSQELADEKELHWRGGWHGRSSHWYKGSVARVRERKSSMKCGGKWRNWCRMWQPQPDPDGARKPWHSLRQGRNISFAFKKDWSWGCVENGFEESKMDAERPVRRLWPDGGDIYE